MRVATSSGHAPSDLSSFDEDALFSAVGGFESERRRRDAAEADVLAALWTQIEARGGRRGDLRCRLVAEHRVSSSHAARRETVAVQWRHMSLTAAALRAAEVSFDHVVAMARAAAEHPEAFASEEGDLLAEAARRTAGGFAIVVDRWIKAHDADGGDARAHSARRRTRVDRFDAGPDMVGIRVELANLEGQEVWAAIEAEARRLWKSDHPLFDEAGFDPGRDTPTAGNYRGSALHSLVCGEGAGRRGVTTQLIVTAGIDDLEARRGGETLDGAQVSGSDLARLVCTSALSGLVFGARGEVLWHGTSVRLATPAQRRAVKVRDRHCTFGGCDQAASRCDVHHLHEYEHDGPTDIDNLALLCVRHHHTVHDHGWTHSGDPGIDLRWHPPAESAQRAPPVAA